MSSVSIAGDTSGSILLAAPAIAGANTATLPARTGNVAMDGPAFSAYLGTNQTAASAFQIVQPNVKEFDTATCYNNTGSTVTLNGISVPAYAFAPNVAGYYWFNGAVDNASGSPSRSIASIYKNGSEFKRGNDIDATGGDGGGPVVSALVYCNGTSDYIQFYVFYVGGGVFAGGYVSQSYFQGFLARAA